MYIREDGNMMELRRGDKIVRYYRSPAECREENKRYMSVGEQAFDIPLVRDTIASLAGPSGYAGLPLHKGIHEWLQKHPPHMQTDA